VALLLPRPLPERNPFRPALEPLQELPSTRRPAWARRHSRKGLYRPDAILLLRPGSSFATPASNRSAPKTGASPASASRRGARKEWHKNRATCSPWIQKLSSKKLSNSSPATATSKKAWAWMALTGRRPAEISFSASFSLPRENSPIPRPPLRRPAQNPPGSRHQFPSPTSSPSWPDPKKLVQALDRLKSGVLMCFVP
jgi:hypothetical protein